MPQAEIMIVEDERIVAEDLSMSLRSLGYGISAIVSTGEEAVSTAEKIPCDLVMMDIVLRGDMDGIEAAELIHGGLGIPVVYVTAHADEATLERVKVTDPFGYIVKPFDEKLLNSVIEIALYKYRINRELIRSREQLRSLSAHLQEVRERERTRIAREIHDELGQMLTALKMDLAWLAKRLPPGDLQVIRKHKDMNAIIDTSIKAVKRIISDLRPGLLDDLGLPAALEWQGEDFQERTGIACHVNVDAGDSSFDSALSTAVFRIFQETLTNVARHSGASEVHVAFGKEKGELVLKVRDNGDGISKNRTAGLNSFGILGIRERAHSFGGTVDIKGVSGKGTTVLVRIPEKGVGDC